MPEEAQSQQQEIITVDNHPPHMSIPSENMPEEAQSQQQEIIAVDNNQHMSIDELLKVIKGANGMPVLFVPSSDGRLTAVAVDGLPNLVPTNHNDKGSAGKDQKDFRSWLLLLTSLVATVTFTAGLTPPGGFWSADDKANGYIAGTSVMGDKSPNRYLVFYYSNTTAFFASLIVIGMLAKNKNITVANNSFFETVVSLCFLSLGAAYIAGASANLGQSTYPISVFLALGVYMLLPRFLNYITSIRAANPAKGQHIAPNI